MCEMANSNGGRTCPKCGMNLGQRHLCPICDQPEENTKSASNPAADAGGNAAPAFWQEKEYVSKVIGFVEKHRDDWDDEFNAFFDGLGEKPDYDECFEACSQVNDILKTDMSSGKISGSMTRDVMRCLRNVFPGLTNEKARGLALDLLNKRLESIFALSTSNVMLRSLYRRATEDDDAEAQKELGNSYYFGTGIKKDLKEAVKWWRRAAEQGVGSARISLIRLPKYR
jgi:hypothetical protein